MGSSIYGLSRAGSFVMLSMQSRFCIDAPYRVHAHEALRQLTITDVGTAGREIPHPDVAYP